MSQTICNIKEKKDKLKERISQLDNIFEVEIDLIENKINNKEKKIKKKWEKLLELI
jgi:hypothetical protein|tara:strand:- start:111 stop:278 length:168 start_codon:yes stop_codon:yes gene_type:complete